jgi:hypothetical protein
MVETAIIVMIALLGIGITAASFYALYYGPQKRRLAAFVLVGAVLVGVSPLLALALGTSNQPWLRGLMLSGLVAFLAGLVIFLATLLMSRRWVSLVSALPMTALALWSYILLAVFNSGVA